MPSRPGEESLHVFSVLKKSFAVSGTSMSVMFLSSILFMFLRKLSINCPSHFLLSPFSCSHLQ